MEKIKAKLISYYNGIKFKTFNRSVTIFSEKEDLIYIHIKRTLKEDETEFKPTCQSYIQRNKIMNTEICLNETGLLTLYNALHKYYENKKDRNDRR
jgi:hypothetical protein